MIIKKSMLLILLLCVAPLVQASGQAHEQGVLSALASDAVSVARWMGTGIGAVAQGVGKTYLLAREYPVTAITTAITASILARWVYENEYNKWVKSVRERVSSTIEKNEQDEKKNKDQHRYKYLNWGLASWIDHCTVNGNQNQVLIAFQNAFGQKFINKEGKEEKRITSKNISELRGDIKNLAKEIESLEKYLVCKGPLNINFYNIRREFRQALKGRGEQSLNSIELKEVEGDMKAVINSKIIPYFFFAIRYRDAAYLWLELKKKYCRLSALEALLGPVVDNEQRAPVTDRTDRSDSSHVKLVHNVKQA